MGTQDAELQRYQQAIVEALRKAPAGLQPRRLWLDMMYEDYHEDMCRIAAWSLIARHVVVRTPAGLLRLA
jgi:hypothetical protein